MGKKSSNRQRDAWGDDWSVGIRLSLDRQGGPVLDPPVADLLQELERLGSITAAAKKVGVSYRHAWLLLDQANQAAGAPLFEGAVGGSGGGGSRLTEHGRSALGVFRRLQQRLGSAALRALPAIVRSTGREPTAVHLAAAISLQEALGQALTEYVLVNPAVRVRTLYGASNEIAEQIVAGAVVDLFVSADKRHIQQLAKARMLDQESLRPLAANTLAVVGPADMVRSIKKPEDLVTRTELPIIVADPACPLGACTAAFLKRAGLTSPLKGRAIYVNNSRAVVASLRSSSSRLGVVYESDVGHIAPRQLLFRVTDPKAATIYEAAVLTRSPSAQAASELLEFLVCKPAQTCFQRCGLGSVQRV